MLNFNEDYFFIRPNEEDKRLPTLKADANTAERHYYSRSAPVGSAPFIFFNAWREEFKESGIKDKVTDVLFAGANFVVRNHLREKLSALELPGIAWHPSVYIDDSGEWHEDFWFVTFHERFDCWDRQHSTYKPNPTVIGTSKIYSVKKYVLDRDLLDKTPLQQRLLFQMGSTQRAWVVCHVSLAPLFRQNGQAGTTLIPVGEY